jgi:CHASE2 domain-containing sensor protein
VAPRPASGQIVLVEVDSRSLQVTSESSLPHHSDGELIRAVHEMDAARVVSDTDLTASPSLVATRPDRDGNVRSVPFGAKIAGKAVPSVAAHVAGAEWADRSFRVDWSIDPSTFDRISAVDLVEGRVDPARISGKSVIVGAKAVERRDFFHVPAHGMVSGALLQAVAAETLLQGRTLASTGLPATALGAELLTVIVLTIHCRLRLRAALVSLGLLSFAIEALAVWVQVRAAVVVDTAAWQLLLAGGAVAAAVASLDLKRFWLVVMRAHDESGRGLAA